MGNKSNIFRTGTHTYGIVVDKRLGVNNFESSENTINHPKNARVTVKVNNPAILGRNVDSEGMSLECIETRTKTRIVFRTVDENDYRVIISGEHHNVSEAEK